MNIQQTILEGIKEQLFFNSYLVFPDFGGFVLKSRPARFSASGGALLPASKTVSFNAQLRQNDGMLAAWLQAKLGCTSAEAVKHLTEFAGFCSSVLQTRRRLSLEGIGFFYLDFENNTCFEPQADVNFMTASFGLGPVSVKEIIAEAPPKKEPVFADRGPADVLAREEVQTPVAPKRRLRRLVMPLSLGIAVVALAVFIVSNARIKGELRAALMGGDSKMSFTPLNYPELSLIKSDLAENTYVADANGIAIIELETGKNLAVKALESEAPAPGPSKTPLQRPRLAKEGYEIVLGCFSVFENANRMASKLAASDVPAYVSGKNHKGMYVVSLGNFPTRELAVEKLAQVKNSYPHAWIKKPE